LGAKKEAYKGSILKDSFENTVYLERSMPYFVFVITNAMLVKKNDKERTKRPTMCTYH
jgi:hypothetical protein